MKKIKAWASRLKQQIFVLYLACKNEKVPWYAKVVAACVVAYAFSPIDAIPDFIPVLGYVDDLILVPLGIAFALKLIPKTVLSDSQVKAKEMMDNKKPKNWIAGAVILFIWAWVVLWLAFEIQDLLR